VEEDEGGRFVRTAEGAGGAAAPAPAGDVVFEEDLVVADLSSGA
jgi:hypothetical protein